MVRMTTWVISTGYLHTSWVALVRQVWTPIYESKLYWSVERRFLLFHKVQRTERGKSIVTHPLCPRVGVIPLIFEFPCVFKSQTDPSVYRVSSGFRTTRPDSQKVVASDSRVHSCRYYRLNDYVSNITEGLSTNDVKNTTVREKFYYDIMYHNKIS